MLLYVTKVFHFYYFISFNYMNMPQCIHPSFDGHLSSFLFASVVSNATMNILFMVFASMYLMFCPVGIELIIHREMLWILPMFIF